MNIVLRVWAAKFWMSTISPPMSLLAGGACRLMPTRRMSPVTGAMRRFVAPKPHGVESGPMTA